MSEPEYLQQAKQANRNRRNRKIRDFQVGTELIFQPKKGPHQRAGQACIVVRAPRLDVGSPSVRVKFADGEELSLPHGQLHTPEVQREVFRAAAPTPEDPPLVQDARTRPTWQKLLNLLDQLREADVTGQPREPLDAAIRHRAAQLSGMVSPRTATPDEKAALSAQLRVYAELDAAARLAKKAGRGGKALTTEPPLPAPTTPAPDWLDQQQRRMINAIAKSIHLRYFISDRDQKRTAHVPRHVRQAIREAGRAEDRSIEQPDHKAPRSSELHRQAADEYRAMVASAFEVCQYLKAGKEREAAEMLTRHETHRTAYLLAQRQLAALRPQIDTGRFFHGDILSVRDEHAEYDEEGTFVRYHGMTQYYTRLTVIHSGDGYTVTIANAAELEGWTATAAGVEAWGDLARWIEDLSERHEGKRRGRRQDDHEHLIYRDDDGHLRLRQSVQEKYPKLHQALEVVRRSLEPAANDVLSSEIPDNERHPPRGYHPYGDGVAE